MNTNKWGVAGLLCMLVGTVLQFIGNDVQSREMTEQRLDNIFGERGKEPTE